MSVEEVDPFAAWYSAPLSTEDWLAGGSMIVLSAIFIPLYGYIVYLMVKRDREIIGYRYLVSAAIADILCMKVYGVFNGIAILGKTRLVGLDGRIGMQLYIDWVFFSSVLHYPIIAWSRFAAIRHPLWFGNQSRRVSYLIASCAFLTALIFVLSTHWQPFMARFYFEPAVYGMLADDFVKYATWGQSQLFMGINMFFAVAVPLILYSSTIYLLIQNRKATSSMVDFSEKKQRIERRLLIPCLLGNIVFVLGQIAVTMGTGEGKWASWTICLLFFLNSALNAVFLIAFSPMLRSSISFSTAKRSTADNSVASLAVMRTTSQNFSMTV